MQSWMCWLDCQGWTQRNRQVFPANIRHGLVKVDGRVLDDLTKMVDWE